MMQSHIAITDDVPGIINNTQINTLVVSKKTMGQKAKPRIPSHILCRDGKNHSNENLDEHKLTDLDKCRINDKNESEYEHDRRSPIRNRQCELHKKEDLYGNESITRRVEYGEARRANLKFKCDGRGWMDAMRRTMVRVRAVATVGLFLAVLATCAAAPVKSRLTRSHHHEKSARNYLESFGYLRKGRPEVSNLVMGDQMQSYEDDFRIAIKTLQEFGGIPVTGEIDSATLHLMKQKRCGRPDREEGDEEREHGHRRKRFAIQGSKWEHTNLTWSLAQDKRPSQLDTGSTRAVLARALDVWQQASRLTFTEISSNQADIVVSFAKRYHDDAYPFDGRGSILAHAFFPGTGRGGDAHFDDDELWLLQPKNDDEEGTSLFAVAVHEFGHSLGLSHSSVRGALMYPWYQGIQSNFVLPEDDRNGIQQMYGPKEARKWGKIPYYRPTETPPPTTTTTTTTTTRRPSRHSTRYPVRYPNNRPNTQYPRDPSRYPSYTPERPQRPERPERPHHHNPSYPDLPTYYPHHRYNSSEEHPRRTHHHRPTETTTMPTTNRPRRPEYPYRPYTPTDPRQDYPSNRPNTPTDPRQDYPKRPYIPEKTTTRRPTPTPKPDIPDACDTSYDAVALIRSELFIFKGKYHWRIGAHGKYEGYPMEIRRMWDRLPKNLTHVDAVYERPDQNIAIFVGKQLYLFNVQDLVPGYPKSLDRLGLPHHLQKIDAAMVWGYNSKTYFYSGVDYWKYDEEIGRVEPDYPRNMAMWKGVGYNIDSVFQWKDGKTYFFKGKGFWKFNDLQMRVEHEKQRPSAQSWMGCPPDRHGTKSPYRALSPPGSTLRSFSASDASTLYANIPFLFSVILVMRCYTIL